MESTEVFSGHCWGWLLLVLNLRDKVYVQNCKDGQIMTFSLLWNCSSPTNRQKTYFLWVTSDQCETRSQLTAASRRTARALPLRGRIFNLLSVQYSHRMARSLQNIGFVKVSASCFDEKKWGGDDDWNYRVAEKMFHWTKCNFSTTNRLLNKNFRIYSGKITEQPVKISLKYFHCFKNYSCYNILYWSSKLHWKNGQSLVVFDVQRR